jgi:hypothetical protein
MKYRGWRLAWSVAAIFIGTFGIVAPGCSSDDNATNDGDASTGSPDANICQLPASNGGPCFPVGPALCFQECTSGGCVCTEDKAHPGADAGIWVCTVDHSCEPDAPPVDFDAPINPPPPDSGVDANVDDAGDDSGDAGADADAG